MSFNNHWMYQGRQYHQWFGHGTAPKEGTYPARPGSLFDSANVAQRIDYAVGQIIGTAPRNERPRWENRLNAVAREYLRSVVTAWYSARGMSRDVFRGTLVNTNISDETVDQLRQAAKGVVEAQTHEELRAG